MRVTHYPGALAILFFATLACTKAEKQDDSNKKKEAPPLLVSAAVPLETEADVALTSTGNVMASEEVYLSSEISGRIVRIGFKEGGQVAKGDLLIKLNDDELRASRERTGHEKSLLADQLRRYEMLLEIKGVSQEEYDIIRSSLLVKESEIAMLEAQLDKTEIRAPFSGSIGLKSVSEGAYITPNITIASLQSIKPAKIDFSVPEQYSGLIATGQKVKFESASLQGSHEATIYAIEPRIDETNRTLKIRATYPNENGALRPGSFARVEIRLDDAEKVLEIPAKALIPALKGAKVLLYNNGQVQEKFIEIGQRFENTVQVVSGISPSDTVITSGLLQLREGMSVGVDVIEFQPHYLSR